MGRRSEYEQGDFTGGYDANAMEYMHTSERVFTKNRFPDLMHFIDGHFFVRSVFDAIYIFAVNHITAHLAEENAVRPNALFGAVLLNTFGNKGGRDRPLTNIFFGFFSLITVVLEYFLLSQQFRLSN